MSGADLAGPIDVGSGSGIDLGRCAVSGESVRSLIDRFSRRHVRSFPRVPGRDSVATIAATSLVNGSIRQAVRSNIGTDPERWFSDLLANATGRRRPGKKVVGLVPGPLDRC
ncbi:MAG: hypothetical protein CMJ54_08380 [Planctomycetaceae bacterium]|nr:hypothetical protein [Planctomycetaceae bacterium]